MGSTDVTVDQGGSGGSDAIQTDGWPMRRVAAEARRVLLELASARFGVPVDQLAVSEGVDHRESRSVEESHLRRTDRRQAVQRHADGRQHQCDHRRGEGQGGAGPQDRRPVAAALRHSRQGGRLVEMGGGRQASRHGSRAQREAAGGGREADQHRRVFRSRPAWIRQGRQQGQLRRGRLRAGRAGDQGGQAAEGQLAEAGDRAVPDLGRPVHLHAQRDAHLQQQAERGGQSRRGAGRRGEGHRSRIRCPVPGAHGHRSGPRHWPIRRTAR